MANTICNIDNDENNFNISTEINSNALSQILNLKIDYILCISLEESVDRREVVQKQAEKYNLPIEFVIVQRNPVLHRGCMESHLKCIQLAKERGYDYVCIFEDDVSLIDDRVQDRLNKSSIELPTIWNMIYLGYNVLRGCRQSSDLLNLVVTLTTHAYIIHSRVYDEVLNGITTPWWLIPEMHNISQFEWNLSHSRDVIDVFYGKYICHRLGQCYGIYPMLAIQAPGYSIIQNRDVDYSQELEHRSHTIAQVTTL